MRTRIVPNDYKPYPTVPQYDHRLSVDDGDMSHTHDDIGHSFPCTTEQLIALRDQINDILYGEGN